MHLAWDGHSKNARPSSLDHSTFHTAFTVLTLNLFSVPPSPQSFLPFSLYPMESRIPPRTWKIIPEMPTRGHGHVTGTVIDI